MVHLKMLSQNVSTMNSMIKKISYVLLFCLTITLLGGCQSDKKPGNEQINSDSGQEAALTEVVDYAAYIELDMATATKNTDFCHKK